MNADIGIDFLGRSVELLPLDGDERAWCRDGQERSGEPDVSDQLEGVQGSQDGPHRGQEGCEAFLIILKHIPIESQKDPEVAPTIAT